MAKIISINLMPVAKASEVAHLTKLVLDRLRPIVGIFDSYGKNYDHEEPWKRKYAEDAKFWLYRVDIGAVGRINTVEDAVHLGVTSKVPAKTRYFTSAALYFVWRIAKQQRRQYEYVRHLNDWTNNHLNKKVPNSRFLEYSGMDHVAEG